jgi:hypothetical protein
MADFSTTQARLAQARAARAQAERAASQAAEKAKQTRAALDRLSRTANANDPELQAQKARLEAKFASTAADAAAARKAVATANQRVSAAVEGFAGFTDPRQNVERLSADLPFLFLPVRVETRFVTEGTPSRNELWVRIYPDDCSVDTFEATLSVTELVNAKLYWEGIWAAGGLEGGERAAWRGLVAGHGTGRASWILDNYQPTNMADKPAKAAASDEILVIPTQAPLGPAEASAIAAYWQAVWLADGDSAKTAAAKSALEAAVGVARAAGLVASYQPFNLNDRPTAPLKKGDVKVSVAFVVFPADPATKQMSWSEAPRVNHLADRFIVLGYYDGEQTLEAIGGVVSLPLYVGPDPSADPSETIHPDPDTGDLVVPDNLQWLVDFDRAVNVGMGLRIPLTPQQARTGFDRLLVIGLELSANQADATAALEELLQHHHYGRSGLAVVPQGAPAHNTTGKGSTYTSFDDPDAVFDDRKHYPLFTVETDEMKKRDGQWLAEALGIDPTLLTQVHGSGGDDQRQARAMQCALWPATLGYWMDKLLTPVFSDEAIDFTRTFFKSFVSGRGSVPAIRIGGQPYGILPTTAFSRIGWLTPPPRAVGGANPDLSFLSRLYDQLKIAGADWRAMSTGASFVGKDGDAHQILLDIVGLHPSSAEFHSRTAESIDELFNLINLWGLGPDFWRSFLELALNGPALELLQKFGYTGGPPDILKHFFFKDAAQIANVVDDRPLSEKDPIRPYTTDGHNYIEWLIAAAKQSLDTLYREGGFKDGKTPETLLYLYLRHALMLAYYDSSYFLHRTAAFLPPEQLQAMKPEPAFVHVAAAAAGSESRFAALYKTEQRITGSQSQLVSDYISVHIGVLAETQALADQLSCLEVLAGASTASLERSFAEHIDCCTYRYDAWLLGFVNYQLRRMRQAMPRAEGRNEAKRGIYLGAYAWLEDLRPSTTRLQPAQLPPELAKNFEGPAPLMSDPGNGGFIHAPSLPHAKTAAVLRSGYLANATPANPSVMSVNLSSDRVRLALSMLEGIRNGQSFGALLGYQFERGLHDGHPTVEVDKFIYPMRLQFPLAAAPSTTENVPPDTPIEAIEARNVFDGMKLVTRMRTNPMYPFGLPLPTASDDEAKAINDEASALLDIYDALADLALAEGVHQAVQGNFERIAATLDVYTSGHFPPDPEVIQTPPVGIGLTHRVGIHFQSGLTAPAGATPRATAEPALDAWLSSLLPAASDITCEVVWADPVSGSDRQEFVSLADLALRPIDWVTLVKPDDTQVMAELDDRILTFVIAKRNPRPDAALRILYMKAKPGKFSLFESLPLLRALQQLVARTRPLRASDSLLHNDASPESDAAIFADATRISGPKTALDKLASDIGAFIAPLQALLADTVTNRAAIIAGIDGFLDGAALLLERSSRFNLDVSGWGFIRAWKNKAFSDLLEKVAGLVARWVQRLSQFDQAIVAYDGLDPATPDDARFQALRGAESIIRTALEPLPATPAILRTALDGHRATFAARLKDFEDVLKPFTTAFSTLLASTVAIATDDLDSEPFDLTEFGTRAVVMAGDIATNLVGHQKQAEERSGVVKTQLDAAATADSATARVDAIQAAAKALLGPEFRIYPEFTISPAQVDELSNAINAFTSGELTKYLVETAGVPLPVDEWLYGVARVRRNMRTWEQLLMLTGAFGVGEPALIPAQLPFEAGAPWLALQYPSTYSVQSDRLLYTAYYSLPFNKGIRQCGILLDEWTEVIPGTDRTTGITFNFDRPNNEPPQSFLLVTPASFSETRTWQWGDVVGALNETLDLAKVRAVEPVHVDATTYARYLPATVMAVTLYGISITTALAAANGVMRRLETTVHA